MEWKEHVIPQCPLQNVEVMVQELPEPAEKL